jgi:hypothetical protein
MDNNTERLMLFALCVIITVCMFGLAWVIGKILKCLKL